jgi:hypothetical protein
MLVTKNKIIAAVVAFALTNPGVRVEAQVSSDPFQEQVQRTYSFEPKSLPSATLPDKAKELDRFWTFVSQSSDHYLPRLRQLLASDSAPTPFFYFDGSRLLLSLSNSSEDKQLAAFAIAKSDPAGVEPSNYAALVHLLSAEGFDVSDAALNILNQRDFQFAIPEHAGQIPMPQHLLNQQESLILMLAPAIESTYVTKAGIRLNRENDPVKQIALLKLIWFSATSEGDRIIRDFANGDTSDTKAREVANTALKTSAQLAAMPPRSSLGAHELRDQRRDALKKISEENFRKYYSLSYALRTAKQ